jgi:hypothetical protein
MSEAPPDDHPPAPPVGLPEDAKQALQEARAKLERTTLADRMLEQAGRPIEKGLARLPDRAKRWVEVGTYKSLDVALRIAIRTLSGSEGPGGVGAADPPLKRSGGATRSPRDRLHQAAVAAAGTTGFFGLIALPVELPVTTALMLRSIADIARSYGEDLSDPAARLACLEVFALRSGGDRNAPLGYFGIRTVLSRTLREAALYLASSSAVDLEAPILVRVIAQIAERFGLSVSEKAAATALPVIGALGGAAINLAFLRHFQELAHGHFAVRRLERAYGEEAVRSEYEKLPPDA